MTPEQLEQLRQQLQGDLRQAMREGLAPTDQKVADLEARLTEVQEELRLAQTPRQPEATVSPDEFRGVIFADSGEAVRLVRQGGDAFTRALGTSLLSSGGQLESDQASAFIDFLVGKTIALSRVNTRRMNSNTALIEELLIASRKITAGTENTAPTVADSVTTGKRTLTTTEVVWAEDVTLSFLEDNIEKRGAESHIVRMVAQQFGNDLNDLAWNGTGSTTGFVAINAGWLAIAAADSSVNDYDATSDTTAKAVLKGTLKLLPYEFMARPDNAFWCNPAFAQHYADEIASRSTAFGDSVLVNGLTGLRYFGTPLISDPHVPADKLLLTPASNLQFGVQRVITLDTEWNPRKRAVELTASARIDYEYAKSQAIVLAASIPSALQ